MGLSKGNYQFGLLLLFLGFFFLTLSPQMATLYAILTIATYFFKGKKIVDINEVKKNTPNALLYAGIAFVIFISISVVVFGFLGKNIPQTQPPTTQPQSILVISSTFSQSFLPNFSQLFTAQPLLAGNIYALIFVWGILIPYIETILFITIFVFLTKNIIKTDPYNLKKLEVWMLIIGVSILFMFFHIQAKGITNNASLILTVIFSTVMLTLYSITKEMEASIYFHQTNNTLAIIASVVRQAPFLT